MGRSIAEPCFSSLFPAKSQEVILLLTITVSVPFDARKLWHDPGALIIAIWDHRNTGLRKGPGIGTHMRNLGVGVPEHLGEPAKGSTDLIRPSPTSHMFLPAGFTWLPLFTAATGSTGRWARLLDLLSLKMDQTEASLSTTSSTRVEHLISAKQL